VKNHKESILYDLFMTVSNRPNYSIGKINS